MQASCLYQLSHACASVPSIQGCPKLMHSIYATVGQI